MLAVFVGYSICLFTAIIEAAYLIKTRNVIRELQHYKNAWLTLTMCLGSFDNKAAIIDLMNSIWEDDDK